MIIIFNYRKCMKKTFSASEALRYGWELTKEHYLLIVGTALIPALIQWVPTIIRSVLQFSYHSADQLPVMLSLFLGVLGLICGVLSSYASFGTTLIYLHLIGKEKTSLSDMFSPGGKLFLNYIIAAFISGFVTVVGLLLFIIPGIIFSIKFQYFALVILDKKLGAVEALKMSSKITDGVKMDLFAFGFLMLLVNLGGLLLLGVGLLATIPMTTLAHIYVYRKLLAQTEAK